MIRKSAMLFLAMLTMVSFTACSSSDDDDDDDGGKTVNGTISIVVGLSDEAVSDLTYTLTTIDLDGKTKEVELNSANCTTAPELVTKINENCKKAYTVTFSTKNYPATIGYKLQVARRDGVTIDETHSYTFASVMLISFTSSSVNYSTNRTHAYKLTGDKLDNFIGLSNNLDDYKGAVTISSNLLMDPEYGDDAFNSLLN